MPGRPEQSVTDHLAAAVAGRAGATDDLLTLMYAELRRLAAVQLAGEPRQRTLQPTALVHEAYMRLVGDHDVNWESRGHFFGAAARAMRRVIVEHARRRGRRERSAGRRAAVDPDSLPDGDGELVDVLALDRALTRLEARDARKGEIVHLRYFAGLTVEQTAEVLGLSATTVKDEWMFSRAWLRRELRSAEGD